MGYGENECFGFRGVGFIKTVFSLSSKKLIRNSLGLSKVWQIFKNNYIAPDFSMGFLTLSEH